MLLYINSSLELSLRQSIEHLVSDHLCNDPQRDFNPLKSPQYIQTRSNQTIQAQTSSNFKNYTLQWALKLELPKLVDDGESMEG